MTEERKAFERYEKNKKYIKVQRVLLLVAAGSFVISGVISAIQGTWWHILPAVAWILATSALYRGTNISEKIAEVQLEWDKAAFALADRIIALQKKS